LLASGPEKRSQTRAPIDWMEREVGAVCTQKPVKSDKGRVRQAAYGTQVRKPAIMSFRSGVKKFRYAGRAMRALVAQPPPRSTLRVLNHDCE
jgi:hypothetical protein